MPIKIRDIIAEEWRVIVKDRRLLALLILVPVLYSALFGYLYINHRVTEIRTVVVDEDGSQLSRQIVQAFETHEMFNVVRQTVTEDEAKKALASGDAKVAVIIPNGIEASVKHGDVRPVMTLIDGSNMLISNAATRGANEIVSTFSLGLSAKKLQMQGLQDEQINAMFQAIPFRYRVEYNPTFNYSDFMIYGVVGAALQQVLLIGISLTVTRDKERGLWARFAVWRHDPWRLAIAKSTPYFLIGMVNVVNALLVCIYGYHLPLRGSMLAVMALSASFTLAVMGIGYLSSMFSSSSLNATQTSMLIAVPSFLLSGFTWPFEVMPKALDIAGHCLPLTYFLDGVRLVMVKGGTLEAVWRDCVQLMVIALITYFAAFLLTRFVMFRRAEQDNQAAPAPVQTSGGTFSA